jgi:uncharacterized protein YbcI
MSAHTPPYTGDALLAAVTASMVRLHEHYHHRVPASAYTHLIDGELLACVMGGVYTDVEKTMIELQRRTVVRETRSLFQGAMRETFVREIQELSGRQVQAFMSQSHVGPDLEIELFLLAPSG